MPSRSQRLPFPAVQPGQLTAPWALPIRIVQKTPRGTTPRRTYGEPARRLPPSMMPAAARMALRPDHRAIRNAGQISTGNGLLRSGKDTVHAIAASEITAAMPRRCFEAFAVLMDSRPSGGPPHRREWNPPTRCLLTSTSCGTSAKRSGNRLLGSPNRPNINHQASSVTN